MDAIENQEVKKSKKQVKVNTVAIRVKKETAKSINALLQSLNKKEHGRNVKPDDLISLSLGLVTQEHHKQLIESTLSNADRLDKKYKEHCKQNGYITRDQFLGLMMAGAGSSDEE